MNNSKINKYASINGVERNIVTGCFLLISGSEYTTDPIDVRNVGTKTIFYSTEFINLTDTVTFHIEYSHNGIDWVNPDSSVALSFNADGDYEIGLGTFVKLNDYTPYMRLRFESCTKNYVIKIKSCGISIISKYTHSPHWNDNGDAFFLLLESGDHILKEDGDKIILG